MWEPCIGVCEEDDVESVSNDGLEVDFLSTEVEVGVADDETGAGFCSGEEKAKEGIFFFSEEEKREVFSDFFSGEEKAEESVFRGREVGAEFDWVVMGLISSVETEVAVGIFGVESFEIVEFLRIRASIRESKKEVKAGDEKIRAKVLCIKAANSSVLAKEEGVGTVEV